jgi:hypothetical protein
MSEQVKYLLKKELTSEKSKKSIYSYYPFGMPMPNRTYSLSSSKYRFGFNGQEKDNEVYGEGNLNTAEFWQYDTRIGRRWNVDPKLKIWESPYATFSNNPILFVDINGDSSIALPTGKTGEIKDNISYNEDKTIFYNNSTAEGRNWDYAKLREDKSGYEFHKNPAENAIVSDADKISGTLGTGADLAEGIIQKFKPVAKNLDEYIKLMPIDDFKNGLGKMGKGLGVVQVATSAYEFYQNPTYGRLAKLTVNTVALSFGPAGGIVLGIADATGLSEKVYRQIDIITNQNSVEPLDIKLERYKENHYCPTKIIKG